MGPCNSFQYKAFLTKNSHLSPLCRLSDKQELLPVTRTGFRQGGSLVVSWLEEVNLARPGLRNVYQNVTQIISPISIPVFCELGLPSFVTMLLKESEHGKREETMKKRCLLDISLWKSRP